MALPSHVASTFLASEAKNPRLKPCHTPHPPCLLNFRIAYITVESVQCMIQNEDSMDDWRICASNLYSNIIDITSEG